MITTFFRIVRSLLVIPGMLIAGLLLVVVALYGKLSRQDVRLALYGIMRYFIHYFMWITGIQVEVDRRSPLPPPPAIFVANHLSLIDSFVIILVQKDRFPVWLAHIFWVRKPLLGHILRYFCVPVDPDNNVHAARALINLRNDLVKRKQDVVIFPEGSRSVDGTLLSFKRGAMVLARATKLPVVPIHLDGLHEIFPVGAWYIRPGLVRVTYGETQYIVNESDEARLYNWFLEQS